MNPNTHVFPALARRFLLLLCAGWLSSCATTNPGNPEQPEFPTPTDGFTAMREALEANNLPEVEKILGLRVEEILTGDPVSDRLDRANVLKLAARGVRVREVTRSAAWVDLGPEFWTFPVPLIRQPGDTWRFDGPWGREEIKNRIAGRNELLTIATLRQLVAAQHAYFAMDPDGDGTKTFAARIFSTPGKRDGLHWPSRPGGRSSPVDALAAQAEEEGYTGLAGGRVPYHGYHFRMLHGQGAKVSGGEKSWFDAAGRLTGGFAILAWPAEYGRSGMMTFVVNQDGEIHEKDFGKRTSAKVKRIRTFNPDASWMPVDPPGT